MLVPIVMDDYVNCFMSFLEANPATVLNSPVLPLATAHTLAALTCPAPETTMAGLDVLALLSDREVRAQYNAQILPVFAQYGQVVLSLTLAGVVQGFPEAALERVQDIVPATVLSVPREQAQAWVAQVITEIPGHLLPSKEKETFVHELHE